jgi:HEAT repeat protein
LNAIYALRLQPDMRAIFKLIDRLDDSESQVAAEAEKALRSLGTPIGKDAEARKQIRTDLKRKGRDEFFRDLLIRQEAKMRDLRAETDQWKKRYLEALHKVYGGLSGDAAKGRFLAEHLGSPKKIVRLWALEKVSQLRIGTSESPAELGPVLVNLISDQDSDVRLRTAKLLSFMGELNSAEKLLEQHMVEHNDEVRTEIFVALGVASSYACLPDSPVKISAQTKEKVLELAAMYLSDAEVRKSQEGAEVIKKLLEQNGLASADVGKYLRLLADKYRQETAGGALRAGLLSRMAGLCARGSACRNEAGELFGSLFGKALDDEADLVREAAVDGLIYIDETTALGRFRKRGLVNDPSIGIRKKLVSLAGEVGGRDDLAGLWEKIGSTAESGPAWEAMLRIFKRSDVAVLDEWIDKFNSANAKSKLSGEQMLSVLEIAEQKAVRGNNAEILGAVTRKLAELYNKMGKYEQAADYFGRLHDAAQTPEEKEAVLPDLLDAYLRWPNVERAAKLIDNCLLEKDLGPDSALVLSIEHYLDEPPVGAEPNAVLEEFFAKVNSPQNRPKWQGQLKRWARRLGGAGVVDKPEEAGN